MSDKITAYGAVDKNRLYRKVVIEFTSTEIIVRSKDFSREIFRSKLDKLIVGDDYVSPEAEGRYLKDTVLKSPSCFMRIKFINPYYARVLALMLIFVFFGGLTLVGVNAFSAGIAIFFLLVITPFIFGFVRKLERSRPAFERFAHHLEKALNTAQVQFAAEGNEIAAVAAPRAEKIIRAQYRVYTWGAWLPLGILFIVSTLAGLVLPIIILGKFIESSTTVFALSLAITLAYTLPLTWLYYRSQQRAAKLSRDRALKAIKDGLISDNELGSLRLGVGELMRAGWKPAAILALLPPILMGVGIFVFAPKINAEQAEQVSHEFVSALQKEDYASASQLLCEKATDRVEHFYNQLKATGEDSFGSLEGFTHTTTDRLGPQEVHYIYKHPKYPKLSFDTVVVQRKDKISPCVEFAIMPLGFFSVEIGNSLRDYLREPSIDEVTTINNMKGKSEKFWREKLTSEEYRVLREKGTEWPFTGDHLLRNEKGEYSCAACGVRLFDGKNKYETKIPSLAGWPSFAEVADTGSIELRDDTSYGMHRTEIICAKCGGHLGHLFDDESSPSGKHYCVNSCALDFHPTQDKTDPNN
jgi:peptide-methionine (R)-S-oxide reductase